MTNPDRQSLIDEWHRNEAALVAFAASRGGRGDPSALELVLLERQDEIEFTIGQQAFQPASSRASPASPAVSRRDGPADSRSGADGSFAD